MAKQKNIKIVYQVDTSQVKQAEQTVNRAKAATDNLNKSTKQLGDQTKHTGQQYKLNIQDVIGEMNLLQQKIQQTAISDQKRLNELIPKYRELKAQVDQFNRSVEGTAKSSAAVGVSLGRIYNAVRIALTAGLIKETASAVIEMTSLAGKIEGVKRAFDKLPNSILLMEELKQRTHGALTELELMQKALQARNFGIPIENLGKLLEFAAIKSQQTGISIQYLTDSIVTGLGRESIKILDNLQIDIGKLKQRMQETGQSMRVVVGEIVNEELKKMGGHLETGETKVNRLKSAWSGFGATVSKELEQSGIIQYFTDLINTADDFVKGQSLGGGLGGFQMARALRMAREEAAKFTQQVKDSNKNVDEEITKVQKSRDEKIKTVEALKKENAELFERNKSLIGLQKLNSEEAKRIAHNNEMISVLEHKMIVQGMELDLLKELDKQNELAVETRKAETFTYGDLVDMLADLEDQKKHTAESDRAAIRRINIEIVSVQRLIDQLDRLGVAKDKNAVSTDGVFEDFSDANADEVEKTQKEVFDRLRRGAMNLAKMWRDNKKERDKLRNKEERDEERFWRRTTDMAIHAAHQVLSAWSYAASQREDNTIDSLDAQIKAFEEYSDRQIKTAGDNERRRLELEITMEDERQKLERQRESAKIAADKREAEREKKERLRQIAIDTAAGIVRALTVSPGWPQGLIYSGILTASAIANAAIVRKYKSGEVNIDGPGTGTSDSIPARISKGESVINAEATARSMNLLEAINARKLDDRIFKRLTVAPNVVVNSDQTRVVNELQKNRPASIVTKTFQIYEVFDRRKGLKQRIRNYNF